MTSGSPVIGRLLSHYHNELRMIARPILGANDNRTTLQPTDLMHEGAMRLLAGTGMWKEIAGALAISESTALRGWRLARAWLFKELAAAA